MTGDLRQGTRVQHTDELGRVLDSVGQLGHTVTSMVANVRSNAAFVVYAGTKPGAR